MRGPAMLLVGGLVLVAGCAASRRVPAEAPSEAVPDYPGLRARIEALGAASASGDDETAYEIHSPLIRAGVPLDEFKQEREEERSTRAGPAQIIFHAVTPCLCVEVSYPRELVPTGKALRCVLFIDGSASQGTGSEKRSQFLMSWERIDGEWYYLMSLEGEACPSPNP